MHKNVIYILGISNLILISSQFNLINELNEELKSLQKYNNELQKKHSLLKKILKENNIDDREEPPRIRYHPQITFF